jgi:hypothetical protein
MVADDFYMEDHYSEEASDDVWVISINADLMYRSQVRG